MPHIKIYETPLVAVACLEDFKKKVKNTVAAIEDLELNPDQITVSLVNDMAGPSGDMIIIEIESLYDLPKRTMDLRQAMAARLAELVKTSFGKKKKVEVKIGMVRPDSDHWVFV